MQSRYTGTTLVATSHGAWRYHHVIEPRGGNLRATGKHEQATVAQLAVWIHALLNGEHAHLIGTAALDDALTRLRTAQIPAAAHLHGALHSTRKLRFFDMDLLWAAFSASGTARFPDRICEVCTARNTDPMVVPSAWDDASVRRRSERAACLHCRTESLNPHDHCGTLHRPCRTRAHARTRARMCARSQRSWTQVTSTCERRLASRTSIVARVTGYTRQTLHLALTHTHEAQAKPCKTDRTRKAPARAMLLCSALFGSAASY